MDNPVPEYRQARSFVWLLLGAIVVLVPIFLYIIARSIYFRTG